MQYARCCAGLLALACALPASVAALPVLPSGVPTVLNNDVPLPTDGVLIFMFDAGDFPAGDELIEVVDFAGNLVEGSIEEPLLEDGTRLSTGWPGLWIWRPKTSFAPRSLFVGTARNTFSDESVSFSFETQAENPARALSAASFEVELHAVTVDWGERTECCTRDDGQPANCFARELVLGPELRVAIDRSDGDPWLRQLLFTAAIADTEPLPGRQWTVRAQDTVIVRFPERRSEYCARIEVFDAITRSIETLSAPCVPDDDALFDRTIVKNSIDLASPLHVSGCHRPPAGFETLWCEANQSSCVWFAPMQMPGCQHFAALCSSDPRSDAGALPEISGNPEDAGCTIARVRRSSFADLAFVLVLVALAARPRRHVGRAQ